MPSSRSQRRRVLVGLTPIALVLGALPLLAPTCGDTGEGYKTFARSSIIIPMDVCYQYQADGIRTSYTPAPTCPQAVDPGNVIKAYGLVYELIRHDIAVYWIIDPQKPSLTDVDLTIQYDGGFPVVNWPMSASSTAPTAAHVINYRGGPFVVDGSDYARATAVLNSLTGFSDVNVHVSNVAFRAYAKKTMAGGWSAGGTVAPKVALLDIGSTGGSGGGTKNSEPIIRGYLARAGLDFPGAGGVATDTGHGQIYDRLTMADFQPSTPGGSWTTTNLAKYGYQILWVPHWFAYGSCSNATSTTNCNSTQYPDAQVADALRTIGAFVANGKDLFAECAGLGSFEGVSGNAYQGSGIDPDTHFQEETLLQINRSVGTASVPGNFSSPLLQVGDWGFKPLTGAIQNYRPVTRPYRPGVQELIQDQTDPTYDYFTILPGVYGQPSGNHGTVVYLAGHVYSGYSDSLSGGNLVEDYSTFEVGGTRLVLNTLFNLGATCTSSGVACNTGQPGVCAAGTLVCQNGQPVCAQTTQPSAEVCNGLDDNCNGEVDEGLETECYDGPDGTVNVGVCRSGVRSCMQNADGTYAMSACIGEVVPSDEVCNALDDDCDGQVDEDLTQACYEGPASTIEATTGAPRAPCAAGTRACSNGSWGACIGEVLPQPEVCAEGVPVVDSDCDGQARCACTPGQTRVCYTGPAGTAGVGLCKAGIDTCTASGAWTGCATCPAGMQPGDPGYSACQILPAAEVCGNSVDENCDTVVETCPECNPGDTRPCYPGAATDVRDAPGTQCASGTQGCVSGHWGECVGATLPSSFELCDAVDNDCNGQTDDGATCPPQSVCVHGVCVPDSCSAEVPPPEGYVCNGGSVSLGLCGDNTVPCADGELCQYGSCVPPCTAGQCAAGSVCGGGACVAGGCLATGCPDPATPLCLDGTCRADPCKGVVCPSGTFCRQGDCVQACAFVTCDAGEKCGIDGFCEPDPCASVSCAAGQRCVGGSCVANPCAGKGCPVGQVCDIHNGTAMCVDDPCTGVDCPVGTCSGGQCFSTRNPNGAGTVAPPEEKAKGGCGCGAGGDAAIPALLALLAAPLARRRRRGAGGGALALLLVAAVLAGPACKSEKTDEFDPTACAETCGEQRCVDLQTDPTHCGGCAAAYTCGSGEICVDAVCGPATTVAPWVVSVSPASGARGALAPVTVQLVGERFAPGAKLRVLSPTGTRSYTTTFTDASHVSAQLDLSAAAAATWQLRVVNPDNVISNARTFDVVVPYPALTGLQPAVVTAGSAATVLAVGTGLTSTSQCHLRSAQMTETAVPSTLEAGGVRCSLGAQLAPGAYELWVVNEGGLASNVLALSIVSGSATLAGVSPSSGAAGANVSLTVTGTGFDAGSRVLFDGCAAPMDPAGCPTNAVIVGTTFVDPTRLVAALPLPACGQTACAHTISVQTGTGVTTATLPFSVRSDFPSIATFQPATAWQGDVPVTLSFEGLSFPTGSTIEVQPPGGAFGDVAVTSGAVSCATSCTLSGTMSLVGQPEGSWLARIQYPSVGTSEAWPFRVLSNQAVLQSYAATPLPERSGPQGATKTATLQVANLRPPYGDVRVLFRGPGMADRLLVPSPAPTGATSPLTVTLALAGLSTGTYSLAVRNPNGATDSNALSFAVTPGAPTLATVSPSSYSQASTNPVVTVTLTGTNFAMPDASGNGGSVVHVAMIDGTTVTVPDTAIAAADTTVVSSTTIQVNLDVRNGIPGAYDVQVWNPALPTDPTRTPQKTAVLADAFTISP